MINPADTTSMRALAEYRRCQIAGTDYDNTSTRSSGGLIPPARLPFSIRRAVGIRLMRTGARIAGLTPSSKLGLQL